MAIDVYGQQLSWENNCENATIVVMCWEMYVNQALVSSVYDTAELVFYLVCAQKNPMEPPCPN